MKLLILATSVFLALAAKGQDFNLLNVPPDNQRMQTASLQLGNAAYYQKASVVWAAAGALATFLVYEKDGGWERNRMSRGAGFITAAGFLGLQFTAGVHNQRASAALHVQYE